jgi:hypothetical protein
MTLLPVKQVTLYIKQGNTFLHEVIARINGVVMDLTGVTVRSQLLYKGALVAEFTIIRINDAQGSYQLELDEQITESLPIGTMLCDIRYSKDSQVTSSETFNITCHPNITGRRMAL